MFKKLGFQLYTIRDFIKDKEIADAAFKAVADMGYSECHTACIDDTDEFCADLMAKHGISIIGSHYDWNKIVNDPEKTMEIHDKWGTKNVGIGGMPGPARASKEGLDEFIAQFNKTAELYANKGFKLTYHNHNFEFVRIDGYKTIMDKLYEGLDKATTSFVLDTCWVAAGGSDVREWMEKLAGRIDILHLKDIMIVNEGGRLVPTMTEVGNGCIYWDGVLETAEKIGVTNYCVEQDRWPGSPLASLKMSADFLKKYMA